MVSLLKTWLIHQKCYSSPFLVQICIVSAASELRTLWYAIMLCFLVKIDWGIMDFITTIWLSQNPLLGPSSGIPIILSLYCKGSFNSTAIFSATNSLPSVLVSIVFCLLEYHIIGAPFMNRMIPVIDHRVILHVDLYFISSGLWLIIR
jgi:hypothetical protein